MKAATLMAAQLHRNPHLIDALQNGAGMRHESIPVRRRGRRRRRP